MDRWVSKCGSIELRQGDWRQVLADVERCDAVITDPPYSPRLHSGFRSATDYKAARRKTGNVCGGKICPGGLPYAPIDDTQTDETAAAFSPSWWVVFGDHISFRLWEHSLSEAGWYTFAPVIWWRNGSAVRFQGDGPASEVEYILAARPKRKTHCGSLPGLYAFTEVKGNQPEKILKGQKPIDLMRSLVRDYSRHGDLVIDPFAGGATTLLACAIEGRRCIGAELDPNTYAKAVRRLSAGWTVDFTARMAKPKQGALL